MDNSQQPNMPSLWVFLIIVLAVLLGVVMGTSFVMHMVQRRQRRQLERRIANGEVDLESLGIKRLNVPQEVIDKMPQYTFNSTPDKATTATTTIPEIPSVAKETATQDYFQPTCSICLDDFVYKETQVRQLPCKHIFHPDCIDPFLRENSSLCPLCKRSALPPGTCPITVTNVMVRRERLTRRIREGHAPPTYIRYVPAPPPTNWSRRVDRIRGPSAVPAPQTAVVGADGIVHGLPQVVEEPAPAVLHEGDTELQSMPQPAAPALEIGAPPPEIARRGTVARRNWRRERLVSMHIRNFDAQAEEAQAEDARRPLWRRALGVS